MRKRFCVRMTVCVCVAIAVLAFTGVSSAQIFESSKVITDVGGGSHSIAAADLNGDRAPDLVLVAHTGGGGGSLEDHFWVLLNQNMGSASELFYLPPDVYETGEKAGPNSVVLAKLNADGFPDLVTANEGTNNVSVWHNQGDGGFGLVQRPVVGTSPKFVTAADLNGDRKIDLAVANNGSSNVSLLFNDGSGRFGEQKVYSVPGSPISIAAADLDGDHDLDLAVANQSTDNVRILLNDNRRPGTFESFRIVVVPGMDAQTWIIAADLDRDGDVDLAVSCSGNNTVTILFNDGHGAFPLRSTNAVGDNAEGLAAADLDCDGDLDLAVAHFSDPGYVSVLLNNGNRTFALDAGGPYFSSGDDPTSVAIADFNGDGSPDLAVPNHASDTLSIFLHVGCDNVPRACCYGDELTGRACAISDPIGCRHAVGGVPKAPGSDCRLNDRGLDICDPGWTPILVPVTSHCWLVILMASAFIGIAIKFGRRRVLKV